MNAYEYLASQRVNIEVMLKVDEKSGTMYYGVRIRPWKQETRKPLMVLSQGLDMNDAMNKAARDHYLERWEELDWAARPWDSRKDTYVDRAASTALDFLGEEEQAEVVPPHLELVQTRFAPPDKAKEKNNRLRASQSRSGQAKEPPGIS